MLPFIYIYFRLFLQLEIIPSPYSIPSGALRLLPPTDSNSSVTAILTVPYATLSDMMFSSSLTRILHELSQIHACFTQLQARFLLRAWKRVSDLLTPEAEIKLISEQLPGFFTEGKNFPSFLLSVGPHPVDKIFKRDPESGSQCVESSKCSLDCVLLEVPTPLTLALMM